MPATQTNAPRKYQRSKPLEPRQYTRTRPTLQTEVDTATHRAWLALAARYDRTPAYMLRLAIAAYLKKEAKRSE